MGRAAKVLAMLTGGTKSFEVLLIWELEVLANLMAGGGGGGAQKVLPCLEGREGGVNSFTRS